MKRDSLFDALEFMFWNKIHPSWTEFFLMNRKLLMGIVQKTVGDDVIPKKENIFYVFRMPLRRIKVVFLGMDPYPDPKNAMGLAFSVPMGVAIPGSLNNIFKEIKSEYPEDGYEFKHGDLSRWFLEEGVFLYNCALTCVAGESGSHLGIWKSFSERLMSYISHYNDAIVFLLMGKNAGEKARCVANKDRVVQCVHPSPLSAHAGFFGSDVFRKVDNLLKHPVKWQV